MSQVVELFLFIVEGTFRRTGLSFVKLRKWSKSGQDASIFNLQLQIGLRNPRTPHLNLWSRR